MRYVELFAGGGGLSHGLDRAGWSCVAHAEIEPHARAVLRHNWPDTPLLGDVCAIDGTQFRGVVDVISGGSPCQDMSVAGKRAGMTEGSGTRSSLFFEQIRIWRESLAPYFFWENVGGAFSSNNGFDFAAVLSAVVGRDLVADGSIQPDKRGKLKWLRAGRAVGPSGVAAWRVFDLQHFGPPQRRVRVFVVGARAGGFDPGEILALAEGVCGHPSPREQAREDVAGTISARANGGGGLGTDFDLDGGVVVDPIAFHMTQDPINGDVVPVIGTTSGGAGVVAFAQNQLGEVRVSDHMGTLNTNSSASGRATPMVLAFEPRYYTRDNKTGGAPSDVVKVDASIGKNGDAVPYVIAHGQASAKIEVTLPTLTMSAHTAAPGSNGQDALQIASAMLASGVTRPRRLTPRECERLMGWPDDWTRYGVRDDGTRYELSDTARYRICGNGVGSPHSEWIGRRFMLALKTHQASERAA